MFTSLKDVDREILYRMKDEDILKTCSVSKTAFNKICDETFFRELLLKRYPKARQAFLNNTLPENKKEREIYLKILYYKDIIERESKKEYGEPFIFKDGNIELYYKVITDKYNEDAVQKAALYGLKDLLKYFLDFPQIGEIIYYGNVFQSMVEGNHFTLDEILSATKDKEITQSNLAFALMYAVINKNQEIVDYVLKSGAAVNFALYGAVELGDIPLINYYLKQGADDIAGAAEYAVNNPNEEVAFNTLKYLEEINPDNEMLDQEFWEHVKMEAALQGHLNIVKYTDQHGAVDLIHPMTNAIRYKRLNVIKYLIDAGFNDFLLAYELAKDVAKDPLLTLYFANFL